MQKRVIHATQGHRNYLIIAQPPAPEYADIIREWSLLSTLFRVLELPLPGVLREPPGRHVHHLLQPRAVRLVQPRHQEGVQHSLVQDNDKVGSQY